jgi:general L-amino acid transport system permease protein
MHNFKFKSVDFLVTFILGLIAWKLINWGIINAEFHSYDICKSIDFRGACWAFISEKWRIIVFGRYPFDEQWRSLFAAILLICSVSVPALYRRFNIKIVILSIVLYLSAILLLIGGIFGLKPVDTELIGGISLTLLFSITGIVISFPIAILLALGRLSNISVIKAFCSVFVEVVRGFPFIAILFIVAFMFPLLVPLETNLDLITRITLGIIIFTSAYQAEVIRGGILSITKNQLESAESLGLGYWKTQYLVILPQALRNVVPSMFNNLAALFKDVSLVSVVGLFDIFGGLQIALTDPKWRSFYLEGFMFVGAIYWIFLGIMSKYSASLEKVNYLKNEK